MSENLFDDADVTVGYLTCECGCITFGPPTGDATEPACTECGKPMPPLAAGCDNGIEFDPATSGFKFEYM